MIEIEQIGNIQKISLIKGDVIKTLPKFLTKNKHLSHFNASLRFRYI